MLMKRILPPMGRAFPEPARLFRDMERLMRDEADTIERAVQVLSCSRHMERIADLATNIAEDVVFMVEGEVIRHRRKA